jgi:hypothetical protein
MLDARLPRRRRRARSLGFRPALVALAVLAMLAGGAAAAEGDACLLVQGRLVGAAEIGDVAKSWDAEIELYSGAEAGRIVAALGDPA